MELTPGMRYIGRWTVSAIFPIVGLYLLLMKLFGFARISLSAGGAIALLVVTFLAILTVYIVSIEISQRRRAAASGARLIPRIQGYLPGNVDILLNMVGRMETDYIGGFKSNFIIMDSTDGERPLGAAALEQVQLHGPVVNLRFLWEDVIVTTEPQVIKVSCRVYVGLSSCVNDSLQSILATDFNNYVKGTLLEHFLGSGVIFLQGTSSRKQLIVCWERASLTLMVSSQSLHYRLCLLISSIGDIWK